MRKDLILARKALVGVAILGAVACKPRSDAASSNVSAVTLPVCTPEARQELEAVLTKNSLSARSLLIDLIPDPKAEPEPPQPPELRDFSKDEDMQAAVREPARVRSLHIAGFTGSATNGAPAHTLHFLSCLPHLEHLSIVRMSFRDYAGIGSLSRLTVIHVSDTDLSDLQFMKGMSSLQQVALPRNKLTQTKHLMFLSVVKVLDLSDNKALQDIMAVRSLTELQTLDVSRNAVTDLTPLANLSNLRRLLASHNDVTSLSGLKGVAALEELNLNFNRVASLDDLEEMPVLSSLELDHNCLKALDRLDRFPKLHRLFAAANPLAFIPPNVNLPELRDLNLSDSLLIGIDAMGSWDLPELRILALDRLKAPDVGVVSRFGSLHDLFLREGTFETAPDLSAMTGLLHASYAGGKVRRLDLSQVPATVTVPVFTIDVSGTNLEDVAPAQAVTPPYPLMLSTDDEAYAQKLKPFLLKGPRGFAMKMGHHATPFGSTSASAYPPKVKPEDTPHLRGACPP